MSSRKAKKERRRHLQELQQQQQQIRLKNELTGTALPAAKATQSQRIAAMRMQASSFSGPLPPPEYVQAYEQVLPGAADRMFAMAERQASHRQEMEKMLVRGHLRQQSLSTYAGLVVALVGLAVTAFAAWRGQQIVAAVLGGLELVSLVSVFIYGRKRETTIEVQAQNEGGK